jgi:hypothetical protein
MDMLEKTQRPKQTVESTACKDRIYHTFENVTTYFDDAATSGTLGISECFSIELVVEGTGTHILGTSAIPCKVNDVYIVSPGVPHGYFIAPGADAMVVRKLTFHLDDWLKGDNAAYGNKHYCYGLFNDGSQVAYAMLNSNMRERVDVIFDAVECELIDKDREWKSMVQAYLTQLFTHVSRYVNSSLKNMQEKTKDSDTVCAAIDMIGAEFSDSELSLEGIAKRLYTSPSQLSRSFKLYTG